MSNWGESIGDWDMGWPAPSDSKSAIRKAGKRLRDGDYSANYLATLNRWRAAHGYVLNTFQSNLRGRTRGTQITVGQRLKRASTIIDKLQQGRSIDLWSMHDIAGVRLIFNSVDELIDFRAGFHQTRARHRLENDLNKYDYINTPKDSGYRGIHDVYSYEVQSKGGQPWNGLLIEVQYRTRVQHAWATAVEMSDMINGGRTKFSNGNEDNYRFFQLSSELLARTYEGRKSCLPETTRKDIIDEWSSLEKKHQFFAQLQHMAKEDVQALIRDYSILIINDQGKLSVETGYSYQAALARVVDLESAHSDWDVVLVGGDEDAIRSTYRNYFRNATEFIAYMDESLKHED
ncbi:RelA/SpoT domain-containing protein [Brucella inopinata]|uniref:RelA/SpoT domain-containing protein n=1 Tax=Brucella inopinata TaxID=1218315 RepID=UPI000870BA4E|nr:RelA/SpoT domain-containing protein [Brucella inopinata]SCD25484.1 hypothetical protein BR141012304_21025 [Brucella inopinata]